MTIRWVTFAAFMSAAGIAAPTLAQEALILGNEDYDRGADVTRGAAVVDAARALEEAGADVVSGRDVTADRQQQLLAAFEDMVGGNDPRLAVLSGRFVSAGSETWFLPVDAQATSLTSLPREAIPLSSVMTMLGGASGPSLLVLGSDGASGDAGMGPFVTAGIGTVAPSRGVTVIRGAPRDVSGFVRDVLTVPGARIADGIGSRGLTVQGDLAGATFLSDGTSAAAPVTAVPSPDDIAWRLALNGNTIAGYVDYLDRYPRGQHASDAQSRLEALRDTPRSRARAAEDDLALGRDARRAAQRDLTVLGFDTNGVDGIFGAGSRRAITQWQSSVGLPQTGYLDAVQIDRLRTAAAAAAPAPVAPSTSTIEAGEVEAWAQTRQVGTANAYTSYLQSYPNGPNAEEARARLAALQRPPSAEEQLNDLLVDGINE
ncbi:MAG: peptidoglycan-binding protein, partial [Jannaschia sp.]